MRYSNLYQFVPLSLVYGTWAIVRNAGEVPTTADYIIVGGIVLIATGISWQIDMGMVLQKAGRAEDSDPSDVAKNAALSDPHKVPNLNTLENTTIAPSRVVPIGDVLSYTANRQMKAGPPKEYQKLDRRIQMWSHGVIYLNAPMTQTFWCVGKNKLFSKPAYVAWVSYLLENKIVVPVNPNADRSTYEPNGRAGRAYIKALADERMYLPFPTYVLSKTSTSFLRAQMRKRSSEGEG